MSCEPLVSKNRWKKDLIEFLHYVLLRSSNTFLKSTSLFCSDIDIKLSREKWNNCISDISRILLPIAFSLTYMHILVFAESVDANTF